VFEISGPVLAWLRSDQRTVLVRTIDVQGFSSRWPQDALAVTAGATAGEVLGGAARSALEPLLADALSRDLPAAVQSIVITDAAAAGTGLSCGGRARVLVQPASDIPLPAWEALHSREAVCVVTELAGAVRSRPTVNLWPCRIRARCSGSAGALARPRCSN
jgi:xanthine dehydrogenase accessory factor